MEGFPEKLTIVCILMKPQTVIKVGEMLTEPTGDTDEGKR
jgi:hypothetical protein